MILALIFIWLHLVPSFVFGDGYNLTIEEDLEIERQLKLLNKPAIKTIIENGDIYDCVDIYKQPAFDHPSLKHHKIQLRPSYYPKGLFDENSLNSSKLIHVGLKSERCPKGTVVIKRVRKEELIMGMRSTLKHNKMMMMHSSSSSSSSSSPKLIPVNSFEQQWAIWHTPYGENYEYYGASAFINVYGLPQLTNSQFSSAFFWIGNDDDDKDHSDQLAIGWTVDDSVYGDKNTRLATSWTDDGFRRTGCVDMRCPGFVQVSQDIPLGVIFKPVSTYNGPQYGIQISVFRDPATLNWWFVYGPEKKLVGYWPNKLFTNLSKRATKLHFGGTAGFEGYPDAGLPPMGSGHFPNEGANKACVFQHINYINAAQQSLNLPIDELSPFSSYPNYYKVGPLTSSSDTRDTFYFGGPGGPVSS